MEARSSTGEKTKKMATTSRPSSPEEETTSEEEEQQLMERFYALVANVRALRAMSKEATLPSCRDDNVSGGGGEQRKKRPRAAPWRPAFEMADFECGGGGGGGTTTDDIEAATTKGQDCNCKGKRSEANAAAEEDEGEVVEGKPVAVAIVDGSGKSTTMPNKN